MTETQTTETWCRLHAQCGDAHKAAKAATKEQTR